MLLMIIAPVTLLLIILTICCVVKGREMRKCLKIKNKEDTRLEQMEKSKSEGNAQMLRALAAMEQGIGGDDDSDDDDDDDDDDDSEDEANLSPEQKLMKHKMVKSTSQGVALAGGGSRKNLAKPHAMPERKTFTGYADWSKPASAPSVPRTALNHRPVPIEVEIIVRRGEDGGLGIEIDADGEHEIHGLVEGSRAWEEGLIQVGDKVIAIDGNNCEGLHLRDVLVAGQPEYIFKVRRRGKASMAPVVRAVKPWLSQVKQLSEERAEMRTTLGSNTQISHPGRQTSHRSFDPAPRPGDERYDA